GLLALTRFQIYVMVMLIARSSLDLAKLSQRTAGTTSVGASSRALDPSSILAVLFLLAAGVWLAAQYRYRGSLPGSPLRRPLGHVQPVQRLRPLPDADDHHGGGDLPPPGAQVAARHGRDARPLVGVPVLHLHAQRPGCRRPRSVGRRLPPEQAPPGRPPGRGH